MDLPVLIALGVVLLFGVFGFRDGVVKRVIEIAGVFVTLFLTARFAEAVAPWAMEQANVGEGPALLLTWAGLFIIGLILSRLLARALSKLVRLSILGTLDKAGGAVVGLAFGTLVVSVLLVAICQVPGARDLQQSFDRHPVGRFVFYAAPNMYRLVRGLGDSEAGQLWNRALEDTRSQVGQAGQSVKDAVDSTTEDFRVEVKKKVQDEVGKKVEEEVEKAREKLPEGAGK